MIRKICIVSMLFGIALQWPLEAYAKKEATLTIEQCRANCDAKAKNCALNGTTTLAGCIVVKNICYEDICGSGTAATSAPAGSGAGTAEEPAVSAGAERR